MDTDPAASSFAASEPVPDLMNDPNWDNDEAGDADTCRICRGEATTEEPLFYPCKCSGSIKFVHQDCLMEWLSHSQKKHCELCKTPFRFTKLYSPNMPSKLPSHIFVRHLVIYTAKNIATWLRACLVIFVWLGVLPWAMRHVWAFLFWLGDGAWMIGNVSAPESARNNTLTVAIQNASSSMWSSMTTGTSPASTALSFPTNNAAAEKVVSSILSYSSNSSVTFGSWLYRALAVAMVGNSTIEALSNATVPDPAYQALPGSYCDPVSMLSEVEFLKNFTRFPRLNRIIITTLEGQIITVVVVVCFILVFLIREWVVQQQPGINMGAGFNAEFPVADRPPRLEDAVAEDGMRRNAENLLAVIDQQQRPDQDRPIARPRRRLARREPHGAGLDHVHPRNENVENAEIRGDVDRLPTNEVEDEARHQRPTMPTRDALSGAAEIQRRLTEDATGNPENIDAAEFIAIWRRANGSPEEVIRIIEAEGLGERLRYWKAAMRNLETQSGRRAPTNIMTFANADSPRSTSREIELSSKYGTEKNSSSAVLGQPDQGSDSSSASWIDVPGAAVEASNERDVHLSVPSPWDLAPEADEKGKQVERGRDTFSKLGGVSPDHLASADEIDFSHLPIDTEAVWPSDAERNDPTTSRTTTNRPRSTSDGPPIRSSISPLANNNWSFSALRENSDDEPSTQAQADSSANAVAFVSGGNNTNYVEQGNLSYLQKPPSIDEHDGDAGADTGPIELNGRVYESWDEIFQQGASSSVSSDQTHNDEEEPIRSPPMSLHLDGQRDEASEVLDANTTIPHDVLLAENAPLFGEEIHAALPPNEPHGLFGHVAEWLWGDMELPADPNGRDDEHIVENINDEAPFVPVAPRQIMVDAVNDGGDNGGQDIEVLEAARAAGVDPNDPDAMDDAEDFEGIMELVGMRGPLVGLLQNALFSAVLISLTLVGGVWIPYNFGRTCLLLLANPIATIKLPLRLAFSLAAVLQDLTIAAAGLVAWAGLQLMFLPQLVVSITTNGPVPSLASSSGGPAAKALAIAADAVERIFNGIFGVIIHLPESEVPAFSALSHESLLHIKSIVAAIVHYVGSFLTSLVLPPPGGFVQQSALNFATAKALLYDLTRHAIIVIVDLPRILGKSDSWVISLNIPARAAPIDPLLSCWGGTDRFWAILSGYVGFCFIGAAYIRKGSPFSSNQTGREWEATVIDILHQAGGVMKVILIISIEMLVFPLYCGMLLDLALLPLFDKATMSSRLIFTIYTPLTSIFVHWFVGTCYMFHFALFVSMCRKIMRTGVLYFIRDPDDPTFHPVRDVLERNVATQLRKITFSAMVYGALVMICLGGVVWSLACAFEGVLPIHWSSNEPVLEFPIDLLFYNFLMPLAVKVFKPADGLHAMYSWWFKRCARLLRLTWFLFDERRLDEEGHHVRKTWREVITGMSAKVDYSADTGYPIPDHTSDNTVEFVKDGRYVRAPGSDQVRLPKGSKVFMDVNEENERIDGLRDRDEGPHGRKSELFKLVYIPPNFRSRISMFIILIWLFAAVTGVSITIVPLVFGRFIFAKLLPDHVQKNDVYAFSIGIYLLGSTLYCALHFKDGFNHLRSRFSIDSTTPLRTYQMAKFLGYRFVRLLYTYIAIAIVLPTIFALTIEFYFIIPLHTYFFANETHTIHFVQSWTLGLLYVKLSTRFIAWYADSRPAEALRAVTRQGYLNPDVRIATRCFIFPATLVLSLALLLPVALAQFAMHYEIFGPWEKATEIWVHRYAYPVVFSLMINLWALYRCWGMLKGWRMRIRDEVYLIGERLHNFGDVSRNGKSAVGGLGVVGSSRIET